MTKKTQKIWKKLWPFGGNELPTGKLIFRRGDAGSRSAEVVTAGGNKASHGVLFVNFTRKNIKNAFFLVGNRNADHGLVCLFFPRIFGVYGGGRGFKMIACPPKMIHSGAVRAVGCGLHFNYLIISDGRRLRGKFSR